jgi:hypothetical protein
MESSLKKASRSGKQGMEAYTVVPPSQDFGFGIMI